jgi:glycerol-3-phosphate dehydrogenase
MLDSDFDAFVVALKREHSWLPDTLAHHYARLYGTRTNLVIHGAKSVAGLGEQLSDILYEAELAYLKSHEWAQSIDDVLDRRTKHRLHMSKAEQEAARRVFARL